MAYTPIIGEDSTLQYSSSSAGTFANLFRIEKMTLPKTEPDEIVVTKFGDRFVKTVPGKIVDPGQVTVDHGFDPTVSTLIQGWQNAQTKVWFKAAAGDGSYILFPAWAKSDAPAGESHEKGKEVLSTLVLRVTDTIEFHAAS